jgi:hypothetical protein
VVCGAILILSLRLKPSKDPTVESVFLSEFSQKQGIGRYSLSHTQYRAIGKNSAAREALAGGRLSRPTLAMS